MLPPDWVGIEEAVVLSFVMRPGIFNILQNIGLRSVQALTKADTKIELGVQKIIERNSY